MSTLAPSINDFPAEDVLEGVDDMEKSKQEEVLEENKEIKRGSFDKEEFKDIVNLSCENGYIDEAEKEKVFRSLDTKEAEKTAKFWLKMYPTFFFFDIETILPLSIAIGASSGVAVTAAVFATIMGVQMTLANRFVHWQGKDLEKKDELAKWALVPKAGKYMPLVYLFKEHPEFIKMMWIYRKVKSVHRKKEEIEDKGSVEFKELEVKELQKLEKALRKFNWLKHFFQAFSQRVKGIIGKTKHGLNGKRENFELAPRIA